MKDNRLRRGWTNNEDRKLELGRLKKRMKMTEDNLEDRSEKDIKDLDLQIKMVENRNEWRKRIYMNDH